MSRVCSKCGISYPDTFKYCHLCSLRIDGQGPSRRAAAARSAHTAFTGRLKQVEGEAMPLLLGFILIALGAFSISAYIISRLDTGSWELLSNSGIANLALPNLMFLGGMALCVYVLARLEAAARRSMKGEVVDRFEDQDRQAEPQQLAA